ncbi:hypothetical protein [Flavobacterium sp.]|jgi:hypothetical protein|uniref:hypothetical protein n=1 Tax=Flavobacterium sp. TaxID=239 RepID=UPI0037C0A96F
MKHLTLLLFLTFSTLSLAQTPVVALDDIRNHIGATVTVCAEVKSTYKTNDHRHSLLNMGGVYPEQKLTIIILEKHLKNFSYIPVEYLAGKTICVTGEVTLFKGKPQIKVKRASEIVVQY